MIQQTGLLKFAFSYKLCYPRESRETYSTTLPVARTEGKTGKNDYKKMGRTEERLKNQSVVFQ